MSDRLVIARVLLGSIVSVVCVATAPVVGDVRVPCHEGNYALPGILAGA